MQCFLREAFLVTTVARAGKNGIYQYIYIMTDVQEAPKVIDDGSESEEELIISASTLLNLGDAPLEEEGGGEGGEGGGQEGEGEGGKTLGESASAPVLGSPDVDGARRTVMFR